MNNENSNKLSMMLYSEPMYKPTNYAKQENTPSKYAYWIYTMMSSHLIMLVLLTVFVALLFDNVNDNDKVRENNLQLVSKSWVINPMNCKDFVNGECARYDDTHVDTETLNGILEETEKASIGLFSSINSPFLCLASLVLSCSFSFSLYHYEDEILTPKMLKSVSLLLLTAYSVLFLFLQNQWNIPFNNLILVLIMFMTAFLIINTISVHRIHMFYGYRLLNSCFTYPLISVSILSMIGEDNSNTLILVFFTLIISFFLLLIVNNEDAAVPMQNGIFRLNDVFGIFTYWLSLLPFIIICGVRFQYLLMDSPVEYPLWSRISLTFLFIYFIIEAIFATIQYGTNYWKIEDDIFNMTSIFIKTMDLVAKFLLLCFVIIGFYVEFR